MPIRMSGMVSGLDTEALVSAMVSSYSQKSQKYEKARTKHQWKTEAWAGLNTKVKSLYNQVGNLRFSSAYSLKKTKVSDPTKATITAGAEAVKGTQSLKIKQLAKSGYLTGAKLSNASASSTLADLGFGEGSASINVKVGDKTKTLEFTADSKISDVVSELNKAGLSANFDAKNQRIFVASKNSGESNNFDITGADANGVSALAALGLSTSSTASYASLASYAKTDADGNFDADATQASILDILKNLQSKHAEKDSMKEAVRDLQKLIDYSKAKNAQTSEATADYDAAKAYVDAKKALEENADDADAKQIIEEYEAAHEGTDLDKASKIVSEYEARQKTIEDYEGEYPDAVAFDEDRIATGETTISNMNADIKALDAEINQYKRFDLGDFTGYDDDTLAAKATEFANQVKTAFDVVNTPVDPDAPLPSNRAIKIEGQDAIIELNGAEFTSNTNTISVNGLNITATGVTKDDEELSITTDTDTQGLYDKVKDFLTQYNSIINQMTKLYNAESSSGYEPLTDEEKDAMSETEIEKWETKIKDSLLRRDTQLGTLLSAMNNSMMKTYEVNGKKIGLSAFGIHTLGTLNAATNEQYAFHIDGDSEDTTSASGNPDKLMAALQSDPDQVVDLLKQVTSDLYKTLDGKMKSNALSSRYSIYNDKEMASEYSSYNKLISKWQDKVADMEDKYYKQFSKMESSLAKLQASTSSITGLFGQ